MIIALIALAAFVMTACPPDPADDDLNTAALAEKINDAKNARYGVRVSKTGNGSDVSNKRYWVTQAQMTAFNNAINDAQNIYNTAPSQNSLNNAVTALNAAISSFNSAKTANGLGAADVTLRWSFWGTQNRIDAAAAFVTAYKNAEGIQIVNEPFGSVNDHFANIFSKLNANPTVDIIQLGGFFGNLNINDNMITAPGLGDILLPLDSFISNGILDITHMDKAAAIAGTRNGQLYAIPVGTNMPAMIYNKTLLQMHGAPLPAAHMTWQQFNAWISAVKAKLPAGVYALADLSVLDSGSMFFGYWAADKGKPQWDGANTHLTAAIVKEYFDMWAAWRASGVVPPSSVSSQYDTVASLTSGKMAVTLNWTNNFSNYSNATSDELELLMLPNAHITKKLWGQMSQMMAVNKNSKFPDEAAAFLNYLLNNPGVSINYINNVGIPVTPEGRNAMPANSINQKQTAYLNMAGGYVSPPYPYIPKDNDWTAGLLDIGKRAASGAITTTQAANEAMTLINNCIN